MAMAMGVVGYPDSDDDDDDADAQSGGAYPGPGDERDGARAHAGARDDGAYPDTDAQYDSAYPDTDAQYEGAYPDTDAQYEGAYPDTDAQYEGAYPDTDAQYEGAYPDTDAQYKGTNHDTDAQYKGAYPDIDAQYEGAYPDTDAQYKGAYPDTDAQYEDASPESQRHVPPDRGGLEPVAGASTVAMPSAPPSAPPSGPARHRPPRFAIGDAVWYTDGVGAEHEAEVVHVDHDARFDGEDAAYTIRLPHQAGREKGTVSERLRPRQAGDERSRQGVNERSRQGGDERSRQGGDEPSQRVAGGASVSGASPGAMHEAAARPAATPTHSSAPGRWRPPEWAKPALLHKPVLEMHTPDRPVPKQKPIGKRPVTIIGRNGQLSDVVIEEASISRAHAAVINSSSATFLQDMSSAHGTWYDAEGRLNPVPQLGLRLDPAEPPVKLTEGGTFRLGSSTKVFRVTGITVDTVQRWQPPPWAEPPTSHVFFEVRANSFANPYLAHRYDENGGDVDEELAMDSACLLVGRSAQLCDSVIRHESISRQHAAFLHAEGTSYVQDLGTPSGTILNHKRIPPNHEVKLRDGDVVSFGESKSTYTYREPLKTASTQKRKR